MILVLFHFHCVANRLNSIDVSIDCVLSSLVTDGRPVDAVVHPMMDAIRTEDDGRFVMTEVKFYPENDSLAKFARERERSLPVEWNRSFAR